MNVAIYARVSTHDKDQNPETQLRPLRQHLAGLKGVAVLGEFIDKAGADDLRGRREWHRLLDLALSGKADLIVVWKLDRAFRSVVDGANTLQALRSGGCGIRSLQEPWIDTTTPIGEAMLVRYAPRETYAADPGSGGPGPGVAAASPLEACV